MRPYLLTCVAAALILQTITNNGMLIVAAFRAPAPVRSAKRLASRIYRPIRQKLWPNTLSDLNIEEPLPPGPLGCPFVGLNPRHSSPSFGPGLLYYQLSRKLGNARLFKFFYKDKGIAIVSGYNNTRAVLSQEFQAVRSQMVPFSSKVVGNHSLRYATDKKQHARLRKLVGMAVEPAQVQRMVAALQATAETTVDGILQPAEKNQQRPVQMADVCTSFALDIAWRLIIGIEELPAREASFFGKQVRLWLMGLFASSDESVAARTYLVEKIESKIQQLEDNGPDDSTVSGMLFAVDEDGKKLSRDEIIDNTLLLILAGTETSASTLTNCILMLGLNPMTWEKLVREQQYVVEKYGASLDWDILSRHCPYADGVVRESLRIRPTTGGSMRGTASTLVVDGYQIPAGWGVTYDRYLTHLYDPTVSQTADKESHMDVRRGFRPERWFEESTRPGNEFIPFGVGPRYCLGSELAMAEMKTFLTVLVRRVASLELIYPEPDNIRWKQKAIIPTPEEGILVLPTTAESPVA